MLIRSNRRDASLRQARLLSQALALEEYEPPRIVLYGAVVILGLIGLFFVGAALVPVVTAASAVGVVSPIGSVKPVQHLEGGTVGEVLVREGDRVEQGQTLLRLSSEDHRRRLEEVDAQYFALVAEAARLSAEAEGRPPVFDEVPDRHRAIAAAQGTLYRQGEISRETERATLTERRRQAEAQADVLTARLRGLESQRGDLAQQYEIFRELSQKGYASKVRYLEAKRELSSTVSGIAETRAELDSARASIAEAEASLAEFGANVRKDALQRLSEISGEAAQVRAALERMRSNVVGLEVRAPQAGFVNKLKFRTAGTVIPPGGVIAEIVPSDETLVIEAKIQPRDVGFLEPGQRARVVVDGFDVSKFGVLDGFLTHISAGSFQEEDGAYYFNVEIAVGEETQAPDAADLIRSLRPGMSVSANIITGERSFLRYLMRPVVESVEAVFSER